jgi:hypothetical protein
MILEETMYDIEGCGGVKREKSWLEGWHLDPGGGTGTLSPGGGTTTLDGGTVL